MSMVHGSGGINLPASAELKSEVAIVAGLAKATVGSAVVDWDAMADDNDLIRDLMARILPGFDDYNTRVRVPRGFWLRNPASAREFRTPTAKANFGAFDLPGQTEWQMRADMPDTFVLQTLRSHDQYNTTVYAMNDRYRGVYGEREVVFINPADMEGLEVASGARVTMITQSTDGIERRIAGFRVVPYDIPRGCIAGYYPELNALVPHNSFGDRSFTPTSKSVLVKVTRDAA